MRWMSSNLMLALMLGATIARAEAPAPAEAATPAPAPAAAPSPAPTPSATGADPGFVDGSAFRALIDEDKQVVEVNLEGPILRAIASKKSEDGEGSDAKDLFGKLKSIHAVIGTVKSGSGSAMGMIQQLDQKLAASGWQRITRIKDETSWVSVLTHVTGDKIDGLVALIFDTSDKELVFANLVGEIDIARLGEIGERLNVPGLDQVPGIH